MSERPVEHYIGLDLAQAHEFTALAVLERPTVYLTDPVSMRRPVFALRHLERFPLGTPYPAVATDGSRVL